MFPVMQGALIMRLLWKSAAVAGACAACCAAPLAIVPLATFFGFATAGLAFLSEVGAALLLAAVAIGVYVWRRRTARRSCQCDPKAGCDRSASCDIPARAGTGNGH